MVFRSPIKQQTGKSAASLALVHAMLARGNVVQARQMLQDRLAQNPDDADALETLAEIAESQSAIEEATILLRRAVASDASPARRLVLIDHLRRNVSTRLALDELELLPPITRREFEVIALEAALAGSLGLHDRQIELYRSIVRDEPRRAGVWISLGNVLKTVGRTEEAVNALQRAIRADPSLGDAYWTLANFKSFRFSPRDITAMRQVLRKGLSKADELRVHFALGKAHEDRSEYEESFRHYRTGNGLRAAHSDPSQVSVSAFVDESIATFTSDFFSRNEGSGCPNEGPIFVIGLHRSGSTLIEQILASHPLVEGTDELIVMRSIQDRLARSSGKSAPAAIASLQPSDFSAIGREYLERTRPFRTTDRPYFVDKFPGNWMNLPLIRLALPDARIIDARRHPMACGFSNFKQYYASGVEHSYNLGSMGTFYRDYWRLMCHFDQVQPGAVCRMINERLIDNPEAEVRRMLEELNLPFEPACLEFHKTERAIRTPSAEQVRRPINREGVDYWRHYEPWLDELKDALGPALASWDR